MNTSIHPPAADPSTSLRLPPVEAKKRQRRDQQRPVKASWRRHLYDIIFEADTPAGKWFDIALLVAILSSITIICLETVESLRTWSSILWLGEISLTALFTLEYLLRVTCVRRPLRYIFSFWGIIDLLSILPTYVAALVGVGGSFVILRSIRLLRVFRVLKLWRMMNEADELGMAVWNARNKIIVFLAVVLVAVTISGTLMYSIEPAKIDGKETGAQFTSIPQAMYWAVVTMTTVGYGDVVPTTTLGKIISAILILLGYSLIIVPSTFVSAEIMSNKEMEQGDLCCHRCEATDHTADATYCYRCGERM